MLILSRKTNQKIVIGENVEITIIEVKGEQVKIGIEAPRNLKVFRREVYEEIQRKPSRTSYRKADFAEIGILTQTAFRFGVYSFKVMIYFSRETFA